MNVQIPDLGLLEYQHDLDAQALEALVAIPAFDQISRAFMEQGLERLYTIQYTGSHLKLTKDNCPNVLASLEQVCSILGIEERPTVHVIKDDTVNAMMLGATEPILVINTGSIETLDEKELHFLLGHQCGYLKGSYGNYHTMARMISSLSEVIGDMTMGVGKLVSKPFELALLRWLRLSQLSNDRAALLACQDADAALSVLIKIAGIPDGMDPAQSQEIFIEQAKSFKKLNLDTISRLVRIASEMGRSHPWTVLRAAELLEWLESGEYRKVLERKSTRKNFVRMSDGQEYCRRCGFRLDSTDSFCSSCGKQLTLPSTSDT